MPTDDLPGLLAAPALLAAPGVHDPLTARIAARAGAHALYLGGNAMALGLGKGQPFLSLSETVDIVTRIGRAVALPLVVDAGAGFGEPAHVEMAIGALAAAGAAALHIDDQPYPKPVAYHWGQGALVPVSVMADRIRAAARARQDALIVARTDALRVTGSLDETVARACAYADAGAQALIILDLDPERAVRLKARLPSLPLFWIGGVASPIPSIEQLEAAGFAAALYPFNGVATIMNALADLWKGLLASGTIDQPEAALARARAEMMPLAGLDRFAPPGGER